MKYSINIEPVFTDMEFCDRIKAAKDAGYDYVEFWGWADKDIKKLKEKCEKYDVRISGFKGDQDWSLCDRESTGEFIKWMEKSIATAKYLNCDSLIIHSNHFGVNGSSNFRDKYSDVAHVANMTHTLTLLAPILEREQIKVFIEPLNDLGVDAGMYLVDTATTADIIRGVGSPNILLLCDIFHMQRMHGDLLANMADNLDITSYVHIADAPDRQEPGTGEINYQFLLKALLEKGFDGYFCFEMWPSSMQAGLKAADELRRVVR